MQISEYIFTSLLNSKLKNIVNFLPRGGEHQPISLTPSELNSLAITRAKELLKTLPSTEQPLLIAMEAGLEFVVSLLACLYAGITVIPVPVPKVKSEQQRVNAIIKDAAPLSILLTLRSDSLLRRVNFATTNLYRHVVEPINAIEASSATAAPAQPLLLRKHKDDVVVIQYTSGSTNNPKGVKITNQNIIANQQLVEKKWHFGTDKNFLNWLPHSHDMGLFGGIFYPLMSGMQLFLMSPDDFIKKPLRWIHAINKYRIHCSGGPPFSYQLCLNAIKDSNSQSYDWDLSCWKVAFCGADYVPKRLVAEFRDQFSHFGLSSKAVISCYGLAESTLFVAGERVWDELPGMATEQSADTNTASEGCLLDEPEHRERICVYDEANNSVIKNNSIGEILISGNSVSPSYVNQTLDELIIDGKRWVRTGDLGFISSQRLYIVGRVKNLLVSNGKNIYQDDILQVIHQSDSELNSFAAQIVQPSILENKFVLLIEQKRKNNSSSVEHLDKIASKIKHLVNSEFGLYLSVVKILPRGTLPRTTSGKIQRSSALKMYQQSLFK